jgi:hypothetical protein
MAYLHDALRDGRTFRCRTLVDDHSRESLGDRSRHLPATDRVTGSISRTVAPHILFGTGSRLMFESATATMRRLDGDEWVTHPWPQVATDG